MNALYKSNTSVFRNQFAEDIFNLKYKHEGAETWEELANTLVDDVCANVLSREDCDQLKWMIATMRFIPGGRYLYYAGRPPNSLTTVICSAQKKTPERSGQHWPNVPRRV